MRRFIVISALMLVGSALLTLAVWFVLQKTIIEGRPDVKGNHNDGITIVEPVANESITDESVDVASDVDSISQFNSKPIELNESQKKVAETLGFDTENLVITPEIITCANDNFTKERIAEFMAGASPKVAEYPALLKCLKQ